MFDQCVVLVTIGRLTRGSAIGQDPLACDFALAASVPVACCHFGPTR
jgi:hypothetical protein